MVIRYALNIAMTKLTLLPGVVPILL